MLILHRTAQAALISELQLEVRSHQSRLQRALDGMSLAFVPTHGERVRIFEEQERLAGIQSGVELLAECWDNMKPKAHKLSPRARYALLSQAISDISISYQPEADKAAVQHLVRYLTAKQGCECTELGVMHIYRYDTMKQDFGYVLRKCESGGMFKQDFRLVRLRRDA